MKGLRRSVCTSLAMLVTLTISVGLMAPQAHAVTDNPSYCKEEVQKIDTSFGEKIPVILVHGYTGGPSQWEQAGGSTISSSINQRTDVKVALNFNYGNLQVVDYVAEGRDLGKSIDCVSQISTNNGGTGKVILIGYSLGAVIGQVALNERDSSGNLIADKVGQFITIANANSKFPVVTPPSSVLIHAIAGDVVEQYVKAGVVKASEDTKGDDIISVAGATSQQSGELSEGGGESVFTCYRQYSDKKYKDKHMIQDAPCKHGDLLKYKPVQEDVITAISAYVNWLATSNIRVWTLDRLTVRLDDRWGEIESASADTSLEGYVYEDTGNLLQIARYGYWCDGTAQACSIGYQPTIIPAPAVSIGGRTPDFSASYAVGIAGDYDNVWCFSSDKICVYYHGENFVGELQPSLAVLRVFDTATWS